MCVCVHHCCHLVGEYDSALNVLTKITSEAKGRVGECTSTGREFKVHVIIAISDH